MKNFVFFCGLFISSFSFGSPLDYRIPMQTKSIDTVKMIEDANRLASISMENKIEGEKNRIYREGKSDPEKMLALAKNSKLARWVVPYFQDQLNIYNANKPNDNIISDPVGREKLRQTCIDLGDVAKSAMQARQRGVSIQDMYKTLEGQDEKYRVIIELIINDAFGVKLAQNKSEVDSIVSEFSNQIFRGCMGN
ncbi:hypothetical protein ABTP01_16480 [Acinetobacter baumannii]